MVDAPGEKKVKISSNFWNNLQNWIKPLQEIHHKHILRNQLSHINRFTTLGFITGEIQTNTCLDFLYKSHILAQSAYHFMVYVEKYKNGRYAGTEDNSTNF